MEKLFCVRAEFGRFTNAFIDGGYVAIGGYAGQDLSEITGKDELEDIHSSISPNEKMNVFAGQNMEQVARFMLEVGAGDFVVTPTLNTEYIFYGRVQPEPNYHYAVREDNCPYRHRKRVIWSAAPVKTTMFTGQFQNSLHSSLSVFPISQRESFFETVEHAEHEPVKDPVFEIPETEDETQ